MVTLTATSAIGATFLGWGGDCSGTGDCVLDLSLSRNVSAMFTQGGQYLLTINKTGAGTISTNPTGIDCGSDCNELYNDGTQVTLTATANSGWSITDFSIDYPTCGPLTSEQVAAQLILLAFLRMRK